MSIASLLLISLLNVFRIALCVENKCDFRQIAILNADREIDLNYQIIKEINTYEIENADKTPLTEFIQPIDETAARNLSYIQASFNHGKIISKEPLTCVSASQKNQVMYKIKLPEPLPVGSRLKFSVELQFTRSLYPFPTHILQKDQQFVQFYSSAVINSAYVVKKQTSIIKIPPGTVKSFTKLQPVKQDGNKLIYGPYENTDAFQKREIVVHFENNSPFLVVTKLQRLIEVSHWGNVAVEESLEVVHVGAVLEPPFSRFEYQRDPRGKDKQPCVKSFKTLLPASAKDVYYRDEIGNISTSHLRQKPDAVEFEIQPRFPLFGGWKTNYYIGYNVPSYEYLYSSGSRFGLKMRFIDHIYNNYVVDEMTIKIILPEGAKDIDLKAPYSVKRLPDEVHYTYLDFTGRPVIVAEKKNLVENHIKDFELYYTFDRSSMIREPLLIVAAFYLLFLVVIIYVRLDFSITDEPVPEPIKPKTAAVAESKNEPVVKKSGKKYQ